MIDACLFIGVLGGARASSKPLEPLGFECGVASLLCSSKDAGMCGGLAPSSSGSTSSSRRSAALSACSARARNASSTTRGGAPVGGEFVEVDNAWDRPRLELLDLGESEAAWERDLGTGG